MGVCMGVCVRPLCAQRVDEQCGSHRAAYDASCERGTQSLCLQRGPSVGESQAMRKAPFLQQKGHASVVFEGAHSCLAVRDAAVSVSFPV